MKSGAYNNYTSHAGKTTKAYKSFFRCFGPFFLHIPKEQRQCKELSEAALLFKDAVSLLFKRVKSFVDSILKYKRQQQQQRRPLYRHHQKVRSDLTRRFALFFCTDNCIVFDIGKNRHIDMTSNRLYIQEVLEKITEKTNNLPPPIFTEKCCELYKQLDKVHYGNTLEVHILR